MIGVSFDADIQSKPWKYISAASFYVCSAVSCGKCLSRGRLLVLKSRQHVHGRESNFAGSPILAYVPRTSQRLHSLLLMHPNIRRGEFVSYFADLAQRGFEARLTLCRLDSSVAFHGLAPPA